MIIHRDAFSHLNKQELFFTHSAPDAAEISNGVAKKHRHFSFAAAYVFSSHFHGPESCLEREGRDGECERERESECVCNRITFSWSTLLYFQVHVMAQSTLDRHHYGSQTNYTFTHTRTSVLTVHSLFFLDEPQAAALAKRAPETAPVFCFGPDSTTNG